MPSFSDELHAAMRHIGIADHILTQTYPLLRDPKLFLAIIENTLLAFTYAMSAILEFERYYKRIPPFQDTFESKLTMLKLRVAGRIHLDPELITAMIDVRALHTMRKECHTEFGRNGAFVLCMDEGYTLKKITPSMLKDHINRAKKFIQVTSELCHQKVIP